MRKTLIAAVTIAALCTLTACTDSGSDTSDSKPASSAPAATGTPAADAPATLTAETAFEKIAEQVPSAKLGTVFTETNDPNKLLGRPGAYTSKVTFTDSRIAAADVEGLDKTDLTRGGSIEVFASAEDAKARADYIAKVTKGVPMLAEYDFVNGAVLVRVSRLLTSSQAAGYKAATADID